MPPAAAAADPAELARRIKARVTAAGFDAVGIAAVTPLEARAHYEAWLAAGRHGAMAWLASNKHRERRADPSRLLAGLRSVVCVALTHDPARDEARDRRVGRIARYAAGEDYHRVMRDLLLPIERWIERELIPGSTALWYSDTGAILERGWAERAGLGWVGKHSGILGERLGSWFLLGEILVDRELAADAPLDHERCGTCARCIEACPTQAIVAPYQLDARRCISYLTIELQGPIPRELRPLIGDWIFGCDVCQDVCPWNRFAPPARDARLHARALDGWTLERFLTLDEAGFAELFATSAIRRVGRAGFLRNVCVALGNRGDRSAAPALARAIADDPDALVREHAAWALDEIERAAAGSSGREPGR
ncbi:MAG: tRNA epoxyqueuosine(34) reductase QueG [Candidatus Eisenbacteria bacterium]|uniref:Epoxyqueuosine reductase n=1 Tax=Eiseniibacteriota bacterium TaxID=2212470 RepID=A0A9D6QJV6_UNCEI|nr:tRNA epoxyqueuosine(34) reductase QueG [Candidatus Eisenbacteria bacterium]